MSIDILKKNLSERLNLSRRSFLKSAAAGSATLAAGGLVELKTAKEAKAFAYEPYPTDDQLETVVT
ncbi:MAG: twin-arginine translocation signal domain-containing protein, partial [Candidatus Thiodiazotropha endolucinida]